MTIDANTIKTALILLIICIIVLSDVFVNTFFSVETKTLANGYPTDRGVLIQIGIIVFGYILAEMVRDRAADLP